MSVSAPAAPGALGVALDPAQAARYLTELAAWIDGRKAELDQIDQVVLASADRDRLTGDMALCLTLWKSVADRNEALRKTWDSGRAGTVEREKLASLIWGRLDTQDASAAALAVSLPEACRLCDAMVAQLRTRVSLDVDAHQYVGRMHDLRAQLARLHDQVQLEPVALRAGPAAQLADLERRVAEMDEKATRGGDIGGLIGPVEIEAATFERDLIVGGAERRRARALVEQTREKLTALTEREEDLRALAATTRRAVFPAPKYAVPSVAALGSLPNTADRIREFSDRLDTVARALQMVHDANTETLRGLADLRTRADALTARAQTHQVTEDRDVAAVGAVLRDVLQRQPCPLPFATHLASAFEAAVEWAVTRQQLEAPDRDAEDATP